jgi:hypothetical protein
MTAVSLALVASWFVVVVVLALALVPAAVSAGEIVACDGVSSGYWDIYAGSAGGSTIYSWGAGSASDCYGSRITGLRQVRSFTYWLLTGSYSEPPTTAFGAVFGDRATLASVDISAQLPTASSSLYQSVTADFGSLVALNANQTYMLAFCATGGGTTRYTMDAIRADDTFRYCNKAYATCGLNITSWDPYLGSTVRTNVTGSCTTASPASQLAPWGALAHVTSLLTALWH